MAFIKLIILISLFICDYLKLELSENIEILKLNIEKIYLLKGYIYVDAYSTILLLYKRIY